MTDKMKEYELVDNTVDRCYEFRLAEGVARIDYMKTGDGEIALVHTEVPDSLQGRGIAKKLVESVLADIEEKGCVVIPLCGFVAGYIRKNPSWKHLVLEGMTV